MRRISALVRLGLAILLTGAVVGVTTVLVAPQVATVATSGEWSHSPVNLAETSTRTLVYDVNNQLMATFFAQNRSQVTLDQIPMEVREAIVAIEDADFYAHEGINIKATGRALVENVDAGGISQGGSTITQQVIKNLVLSDEATIERKLQGGLARGPARGPDVQRRDPRGLPEHGVLRCGCLWRQGRCRGLLRTRHGQQDRRGDHPHPRRRSGVGRGCASGVDHQQSERQRSDHQPRRRRTTSAAWCSNGWPNSASSPPPKPNSWATGHCRSRPRRPRFRRRTTSSSPRFASSCWRTNGTWVVASSPAWRRCWVAGSGSTPRSILSVQQMAERTPGIEVIRGADREQPHRAVRLHDVDRVR